MSAKKYYTLWRGGRAFCISPLSWKWIPKAIWRRNPRPKWSPLLVRRNHFGRGEIDWRWSCGVLGANAYAFLKLKWAEKTFAPSASFAKWAEKRLKLFPLMGRKTLAPFTSSACDDSRRNLRDSPRNKFRGRRKTLSLSNLPCKQKNNNALWQGAALFVYPLF